MGLQEDKAKTRWSFLGLVLVLTISVLCLAGCAGGNTGSGSANEPEQKDDGFSIVGVYHSQTGISDPAGYAAVGTSDYNTAKKNLTEGETGSDDKCLYVAIEIEPDERQNKEIKGGRFLSNGSDKVSGATLTVDNINEYDDNWALNDSATTRKVYSSKLVELGYTNGTTSRTLSGGSDEPYRAIFVFDVNNVDFEQGEIGVVKWNDYSAEFNMADIQTVETPLAIVDALAALEQ